jgi:hypothetical protein
MRLLVEFVVSVIIGFFLMAPLGMLFDRMNWPLFHTWGLVHGSFIFAWPILTLMSFGVIRLDSLLRRRDPQVLGLKD